MERNFPQRRKGVVRAESANSLEPQDQRKRGRNQPEVVEMIMENPGTQVWFDSPSIHRIHHTGNDAQGIAAIAKWSMIGQNDEVAGNLQGQHNADPGKQGERDFETENHSAK